MEKLDEGFKEKFNQHTQSCIGKITDSIKNEKYNSIEKVKALFKNDLNFNERVAIQELIKETYAPKGERKLDYMIVNSIEAVNRRNLNTSQPNVVSAKKITTSPSLNTMKFLETSNDNKIIQQADEEVSVSDVETETSDFSKVLNSVNQYLNTINLEVTLTEQEIKQLPIIAGMIMQHLILTRGEIGNQEIFTEGIEQYKLFQDKSVDMEAVHQEYSNLFLDANRIVTGAAIFFGVDALDGTLNGFEAIGGLLGTLEISATLGTTLSVVGLSTITGLIAVQKGSAKIEKFKYERHEYSRKILEATANHQREAMLGGVNRIMDEIQGKLAYAYQVRRQDGLDIGLYEEVEVRIQRLENQCEKLREEAFRNAGLLN